MHLSILPSSQQRLWPLLSSVPKPFVLYGGTAIALRLGHRLSVDFDFFSAAAFNPDNLLSTIPFLKTAEVIQKSPNTLTVLVDVLLDGDSVKVSFFGNLPMGQIESPTISTDNAIKIASLIDLFGMKSSVVCSRIELKDYLDIIAIIRSGFALSSGLAAAQALYKGQYHPMMTLKALSCFDGGDLEELSLDNRSFLLGQVKNIDVAHLPVFNINGSIGDIA